MEGDEAVIGITDLRAERAGRYRLHRHRHGRAGSGADAVFGTVEAVKTVSDLFMPSGSGGESGLADDPAAVNKDPYGEGWNPGAVKDATDWRTCSRGAVPGHHCLNCRSWLGSRSGHAGWRPCGPCWCPAGNGPAWCNWTNGCMPACSGCRPCCWAGPFNRCGNGRACGCPPRAACWHPWPTVAAIEGMQTAPGLGSPRGIGRPAGGCGGRPAGFCLVAAAGRCLDQTIIPAATVSLVPSSIRIRLPV
jgi:hypothetical protein